MAWLAAAGASAQPSIGVAWQESDGTIVLQLAARGDGATQGDGLIRYRPSDPNYQAVARHLGPIPPGRSVAVTPFEGDR